MNITKVTKLEEKAVQTLATVPTEPVKEELTQPAVEVKAVVEEPKSPELISFDPESIMRGIVMGIILGPPKGRMSSRGLL